jgi:hypothetical protein
VFEEQLSSLHRRREIGIVPLNFELFPNEERRTLAIEVVDRRNSDSYVELR